MNPTKIRLAEVAGWRALLTEAQHLARIYLAAEIEEYLVRLLYQVIGQPGGTVAQDAEAFVERLASTRGRGSNALLAVGEESLVFAGLFPEQAIRKGIPITYFVQVGVNAYRELAVGLPEGAMRGICTDMADRFVDVLDVLHTLREMQSDMPCIDGLNAYQLWHEAGSSHAWQVLRQLTSAFPGPHASDIRH